jgi:hypothetical protein
MINFLASFTTILRRKVKTAFSKDGLQEKTGNNPLSSGAKNICLISGVSGKERFLYRFSVYFQLPSLTTFKLLSYNSGL